MPKLLLIEDDRTFSKIVQGFLSKKAFDVVCCYTGKEGLKAVRDHVKLVLLDYRLPDMNGLEILTAIRKDYPLLPVIIMTNFSDVRTAVQAVKAGAYEYITKPVDPDELLFLINEALKSSVSSKKQTRVLVGKSSVAKQIQETIALVAPSEFTVIIEGESGTGKENTARSIHANSKRSGRPFVAVDCGVLSAELASSELFGHVRGAFTGAISDKVGQIQAADGGTLFLDEVGNLSLDVQVKLLRAIQERLIQPVGSNQEISVDVRIITATHEDLLARTRTGLFREDLYHRLNEFRLHLPPLRERGPDLLLFADHFKSEAATDLGKSEMEFSKDVRTILERYAWPGNLRELRNVVRRAVLLTQGTVIEVAALPHEMAGTTTISSVEEPDTSDLKVLNERQEREMIVKILRDVNYNKSKAARELNIDRKTLYMKMTKYGING